MKRWLFSKGGHAISVRAVTRAEAQARLGPKAIPIIPSWERLATDRSAELHSEQPDG